MDGRAVRECRRCSITWAIERAPLRCPNCGGPTDALSPTEQLRERLRARLAPCPVCGRAQMSYREAAALIGGGINQATLWRFVRGHTISSTTYDRIAAWIGAPSPAPASSISSSGGGDID